MHAAALRGNLQRGAHSRRKSPPSFDAAAGCGAAARVIIFKDLPYKQLNNNLLLCHKSARGGRHRTGLIATMHSPGVVGYCA
jgi:hypothetical protein